MKGNHRMRKLEAFDGDKSIGDIGEFNDFTDKECMPKVLAFFDKISNVPGGVLVISGSSEEERIIKCSDPLHKGKNYRIKFVS